MSGYLSPVPSKRSHKHGDTTNAVYDFHPTPPGYTRALLRNEEKFAPPGFALVTSNDVWEPACGIGSMSRVLAEQYKTVFSTDVQEGLGFGIGGIDFLEITISPSSVIITNPPYKLAIDFLKHALSLDEVKAIAFLVKLDFFSGIRLSKSIRLFGHMFSLTE